MASECMIRKCSGLDELKACVALQKEVWGFEDADLVPLRMFVVAESIGGQVIGAFDGGALVGYVLAVPGAQGVNAYLHSHMLAVRQSYRNHGLGRLLKLAQREDALQRGFSVIEWTFDPLEIKNAWLNIKKLGATVQRYYVNHYGHTTSALHHGLPTDRLVAEWRIQEPRVVNLLEHGQEQAFAAVKKITVPGEIYAWKSSKTDLPKAAEAQTRNREEFQQAFSQGLTVLGFECDPSGEGKYLLGRTID